MTLYTGRLSCQPAAGQGDVEAAPSIIHLLDRMGVMFNRTPEGPLDFRRFGVHSITEQLMRVRRRGKNALRTGRASAQI